MLTSDCEYCGFYVQENIKEDGYCSYTGECIGNLEACPFEAEDNSEDSDIGDIDECPLDEDLK